MAPNSSIISINGKRYDARSGKLLSVAASQVKNPKKTSSSGVVMDGVIRKPQPHKAPAKSQLYKQGSLEKPRNIHHAKPAKAVHGKVKKSQTLFRTGVKKPQPGAQLKVDRTYISKSTPPAAKSSNVFNLKTDPQRQKRADSVAKSSFISKFSNVTRSDSNPETIQPDTENTAVSGEVIMPDEAAMPASQPSVTKSLTKPKKADIDDLVDHALAIATAHKQQKKPKKRLKKPRLASAMAILLVVFLLGGFFAYQYVPNFAMRVASQRSGVNGTLPDYLASGFSFDSIDVSPGTVEVNYVANADNQRSYSLMQKNSNWDSQSLYNNFVLMEDKNPQSSQNNGKTVYLYDGNNATWVSGGIWYVIDGSSAQLTSDQLVKIASSI